MPSRPSSILRLPKPYRLVTLDLASLDAADADATDPNADAAGWEQARAWTEVQNRSSRFDLQEHEMSWTAAELVSHASSTAYDRLHLGVVEPNGGFVAMARISFPLKENRHLGTIMLHVHPEHRSQGIGRVLLAELELAARSRGRTTLVAEASLLTEVGDERKSQGMQFATLHGYAVAQTVLGSVLELDGLGAEDGFRWLDDHFTKQARAAGYELETAVDGIPDEWLEDRAHLARRMSTDAPLGDLDMGEEDWNADRVRRDYEIALSTRRVVETVVRHVESGRLVGFTVVAVSAGPPVVGYQQDTLVLREHRGHGLGLALKCRNAVQLLDHVPDCTVVRTFNAEDNRPMLSVNYQMGYEPRVIIQERQKVL